ncbi:DUF4192 family protein [Arthrobacter sp. Soil763]|uniref:DUF4192 family protein n=1 Tax=Arthrobacter sp. Soil763 TaxID=1736402 RepID=UPI0006F9AE09|nr:DUF4192 family protein [Arthrobacter sp. Soil763]KRE78765.1 hypothetical protein ASG71_13075 [Arthrobacter sp. Soil763]
MTAPEQLKATGPEDILGFIPHSLGYWPASSLVAMTVQGKRLGATLRLDLPDPSHCRGPGLAAFARTVLGYLESDPDADGTLLAVFTAPDPGDPEKAVPDAAGLDRLLAQLQRTLGAAGLPVRDAWLIGEHYWRSALCNDPSCCAPPGRPVEEIRNSRLNAELVFRGSRVGAAPAAGTPGEPPENADPAAAAAEADWGRTFSGRWRDRAQFAAVLDVWERVLAACADPGAGVPALPPGLAGYLRATLCVPPWRDAVLVLAAAGRRAAEAGAEEFGSFDAGPGRAAGLPPLPDFPPAPEPKPGPEPATDSGPSAALPDPGYGEVLLGLEPAVPDWARLAQLDRLLARLEACGGGESRAAGLTGRAWIEWCRGRGSYADALLCAAAAAHPGYRLAELLAELVRRGTLCGWAGRKEAAWQRFDPDAA